jgi:hypothetical protein
MLCPASASGNLDVPEVSQVVMAALSDQWKLAPASYVPEPFRNIV